MNIIFRNLCIFLFIININCEGIQSEKRRKVCVIGAGAGGLASVKQVASNLNEFEPVVFEKSLDIGGLWKYTDSGTIDEHGLPVHSSIYKNMRTNLPMEMMVFPDYRTFDSPKNRSFVSHETVLDYVRNYTAHFNLYQYIQFDTLVEKVTPQIGNGDWKTTSWLVTTRNLNTNMTSKTTCDAIMVCNGKTFHPIIPNVTGIDNFNGRVLHSHSYRRPEDFTNQTIVVLGAGPSGQDISAELINYAKQVYLSHRHEKIAGGPRKLVQVPGVVAANKNELILSNGTKITADALIYCTGYVYDFPFLDTSSGIIIDNGKYVHPLYKHLINVEHPSMSFIGIPSTISGFPIFNVQARYFVSLLQGKMTLPSREEMLKQAEVPTGKPKKKVHSLGNAQWAYYNDLAKEAGFEPLPDFYERCNSASWTYWETHKFNYKDGKLRVLDDGSFTFVEVNN